MKIVSAADMREIDRVTSQRFGVPSHDLMENAGSAVADFVLSRYPSANRIGVICGKGNNGGDGFVIARHLEIHGYEVRVLLFADPHELTGDALTNYRVLSAAGTPIRECAGVDAGAWKDELSRGSWIVDALLGTGARGAVREPFGDVIDQINAAGRRVLAVDLPSGLDCDTGQPLGPCVRAAHTGTFVAPKRGFDAPEAAAYTGQVHVIDIGVPPSLLREFSRPAQRP